MVLRRAALIAIPVGAAGSVALFFRAADHPPPLLVMLFILWLISPFALLGGLRALSSRWTSTTRMTLDVVTMGVALASVAIYSGAIRMTPAMAPNAARFVITAPMSWLIIAIAVSLAAIISRSSRSSVVQAGD